MKKVSTKQNQRHIQMNKIKIAGRRIQKAQKRMMRLARG